MDRLLKGLHLLPWRNDLSVRKVTLRDLQLISGARDGEPEFYSPDWDTETHPGKTGWSRIRSNICLLSLVFHILESH